MTTATPLVLPRRVLCAALLVSISWLGANLAECRAADKPRLLVLTDIGGDPDDQQSLVRLLVHSNEFQIEGLVASASGTPGELKKDIVQPQLIRQTVTAYGKVRKNLAQHAEGFPTEEYLAERIKSGNPRRGVDHVGEGHDTEGSRWIIELADRADDRPLDIVIWGGSTELAQALWRVRRDRSEDEVKRFLSRLRVYAISHQDNTGPWILQNFPDLFYICSVVPKGADRREAAYRGMYLGGDEKLTSLAWLDEHVRKNHGPLGALYPAKTWTAPNPNSALKEGDSPSWLYFFPVGLSDAEHPEWGSWGGRFKREQGGHFGDDPDTVDGQTHARATVWRWRGAVQNEFAARMDWCVLPPDQANHPPRAGFRGKASREIVSLKVKPDEAVVLNAAGSTDPDGDKLTYRWFVYPEAGTYRGQVNLRHFSEGSGEVIVPTDIGEQTIHLILEVTDNGQPPLTRYRRVILRGQQ